MQFDVITVDVGEVLADLGDAYGKWHLGRAGCIRQTGEGSERVWGHLAAQDAGEAHINIVLAAFVPASYLAVAPLSHWPDVLSAARHPGSRARRASKLSKFGHMSELVTDKTMPFLTF